jgi:hypothetical protein
MVMCLITQNIGDFHRLHKEFLAQGKSHAGIILMRQQSLTIGGKLRRILKIQNAISNEEMRNRIEFLSNW